MSIRTHGARRNGLATLVGAIVLGLGALAAAGLSGCGTAANPAGSTGADTGSSATVTISTTSTTSTTISSDPALLIAKASGQLEAALGLPGGAVSKSSETPVLPGSDAALKWDGGRANIDFQSGHISMILMDVSWASPGAVLDTAQLDQEANRIVGLLGWDSATLANEGFTPGKTGIVSHVNNDAEYSKQWNGHDSQGNPNQGLIDMEIDATTGRLLRFFFMPGPTTTLDASQAISRDAAIQVAKDTIGDNSQVPTTTAPASGGSTTTTAPLGVLVVSAELTHTDAPGITGGRDMLVWIVKLGGSTATGGVSATVYVDALTGKTITWLVGVVD